MTDDRKDQMLEKVRGLLAKAADPAVGEAEAQVFREGAERLMTKYTIESWMIERAQEGDQRSVQPERRDVSLSWYYDMSYENPVRDPLWWMFDAVARHCRCKVVLVKRDYEGKTVPVFGIPADLDYMDMLFTNLMVQMLAKADPRPLERLSLEENLAMMREAGLDWAQITQRLIKAGMIEDPTPGAHWYAERKDWKAYGQPERYSLSQKMVSTYRRWCKATGREQTYTNVKTYRRDFAAGFSDEINNRLWRMKRAAGGDLSEDDSNSMALAVRDIEQVVQAAVWDAFEDLRPHPPTCECDNCHFMKCNDGKCERPRCKAARKPVRYRSAPMPKVDHAAREAGRQAGAAANISNPGGARIGKTPELPR